VQGLHRLQDIITGLRDNFEQTTIAISGIFLTLADPRTLAVPQVLQYLRQQFPDRVCRTIITRSIQLPYALARRQTIFTFNPYSKLAEQYVSLTKEVLAYEHPKLQTRVR
jgi:cellulose biosynthesis protein BcsQ